jgi:hypothetical protein
MFYSCHFSLDHVELCRHSVLADKLSALCLARLDCLCEEAGTVQRLLCVHWPCGAVREGDCLSVCLSVSVCLCLLVET